MDAVKFIREEIRMCASYQDCCNCPLDSSIYCSASPKKRSREEAGEIVRQVEEWSAAHPRKTRQSVFLEQWPEAELDTNGAVAICPTILSCDYRSANKRCKHPGTACSDCRREFWMQEVE